MTQNVAGWMPWLIGPVTIQVAGVAQTPRMNINFAGGTASDNGVDTLTITPSGIPTTLGPDGTTFANITAPISNTANPKQPTKEYLINQINSVATAVAAATIPTVSNRVYSVRGVVGANNSAANAYGEWDVKFFAKNVAGVLTITTGAPVTQNENNASLVVAAAVSGTNIVINVTDPAAPGLSRRFTGTLWVAEHQI